MQIIKKIKFWFAYTFLNKEPESEYSVAKCIAYNKPLIVSNTTMLWNFQLDYATLCIELRNDCVICVNYRFAGCLLSHVIGEEDAVFIVADSTGTKKVCLKVSELHGINFGLILKESDLAYVRLLA